MTATTAQGDTEIKVDSTKPVDVRFDCDTPHVVVYALWSKQPNADWVNHANDELEGDGEPKSHQVPPPPKKTEIAYWLGIGGNPGTTFRVTVTFLQSGIEIRQLDERGQINERGEAIRKATLLCV
jgi:hypothetical protein